MSCKARVPLETTSTVLIEISYHVKPCDRCTSLWFLISVTQSALPCGLVPSLFCGSTNASGCSKVTEYLHGRSVVVCRQCSLGAFHDAFDHIKNVLANVRHGLKCLKHGPKVGRVDNLAAKPGRAVQAESQTFDDEQRRVAQAVIVKFGYGMQDNWYSDKVVLLYVGQSTTA